MESINTNQKRMREIEILGIPRSVYFPAGSP